MLPQTNNLSLLPKPGIPARGGLAKVWLGEQSVGEDKIQVCPNGHVYYDWLHTPLLWERRSPWHYNTVWARERPQFGFGFFPQIKQNRMITLYCPNLDISQSPGQLFIVVPGQAKIVGEWWPTQQPCSQRCQPFIYLFKFLFLRVKWLVFLFHQGLLFSLWGRRGEKRQSRSQKNITFKTYPKMYLQSTPCNQPCSRIICT